MGKFKAKTENRIIKLFGELIKKEEKYVIHPGIELPEKDAYFILNYDEKQKTVASNKKRKGRNPFGFPSYILTLENGTKIYSLDGISYIEDFFLYVVHSPVLTQLEISADGTISGELIGWVKSEICNIMYQEDFNFVYINVGLIDDL